MPGKVQSPAMLRTLLPLDSHVPVSPNHLPPCTAIMAEQANVSTLFTTVG